MAEGPPGARKKPSEKDSIKSAASEEAAEDQDEDPFFKSEIDDLLTGEIDSADQKLLEKVTTSDEGLNTAGTLSKTSDLPVDLEDLILETDRIVDGNKTKRVPSVATSGRKRQLQSKSSQKTAPVSRKPLGENQQSSAVASSAAPAGNSALPADKADV
ncbi:hypothetical protein V5799_003410 [Amblyomma americanum]|uniref:Uncharacterized protein n=1 Tax=Amblyomma americanum TaxID=6943 RepID=A0AAQ4D919_AMBAM